MKIKGSKYYNRAMIEDKKIRKRIHRHAKIISFSFKFLNSDNITQVIQILRTNALQQQQND